LILLCDEDVGTGIPKALDLVGCETKSLRGLEWAGKPDTWWLAQAGQNRWLVLSCNKKMLKVPNERDTIVLEKVGVVFLTSGQEYSRAVLRLLLSKWDTLELLWNKLERPFAYFLSPNGRLSAKYKDYQLL